MDLGRRKSCWRPPKGKKDFAGGEGWVAVMKSGLYFLRERGGGGGFNVRGGVALILSFRGTFHGSVGGGIGRVLFRGWVISACNQGRETTRLGRKKRDPMF